MDYRSDISKYTNMAFLRGVMIPLLADDSCGEPQIVGFRNWETRQEFVWTNKDRIVRLDSVMNGTRVFPSVLQHDGYDFTPVASLPAGEFIDYDKRMEKKDLVPQARMWQRARDVSLRTGGLLLAGTAVGMTFRSMIGVAAGFAASRMHRDDYSAAHAAVVDPARIPDAEALHETHRDAEAWNTAHDDGGHVVSNWAVPGSDWHPVQAPNGGDLDGTHESALRAMLPGICPAKARFLVGEFSARDDMPVGGTSTELHPGDYQATYEQDETAELAVIDYIGAGIGAVGCSIGGAVVAHDIVSKAQQYAQTTPLKAAPLRTIDSSHALLAETCGRLRMTQAETQRVDAAMAAARRDIAAAEAKTAGL